MRVPGAGDLRFEAVTMPRLLAVGGAHIDRRGRVAGEYVAAASNPGVMREEIGGGAFNAARAAAARGASVSLMSLRGGDAAGGMVASAIAGAGIADLSVTYLDRATPSYTALIDREGELIAGLADMGLYEAGFARQLGRRAFRDAAGGADALLLDANLPEPALRRALAATGAPCFAIAVSPAKAVRFAALLDRLALLFMNRREAAALVGAAEPPDLVAGLRAAGLRAGVVTAGGGAVIAFEGARGLRLQPPSMPAIADVTGAGDALAGAAVAALMRGAPFAEALREGVAAALIAVASPAAAPRLEEAAFALALARVPEPETF